jgi:hypothetical protein
MKKGRQKEVSPDQLVEVVGTLLQNIYWNGFRDRRGAGFRIQRAILRSLFESDRLKTSTIEKLVEHLKPQGFFLYPFDRSNPAAAREWIFEKLNRVSQLPLADEVAINRAQQRAKATD